MYKIFLIILFFVKLGSFVPQIGNYSKYIPDYDKCGIGKMSIKPKQQCFEYHPEMSAAITNARNTRDGEAPWVVLILSKMYLLGFIPAASGMCTGTFISPRWILTAAHCLSFEFYYIYPSKQYGYGTYYKSAKWIKHPKFVRATLINDIGLIKLTESADLRPENENFYKSNTICLPQKGVQPTKWELGYTSGWGKRESVGYNRLKIGNRLIDFNRFKTFVVHKMGDAAMCQGDSGGPLWQYHMGRAVLIGVMSHADQPVDNCNYGLALSTYVPDYIDWIINTTLYE